jgi:hypothetical protein
LRRKIDRINPSECVDHVVAQGERTDHRTSHVNLKFAA